MVASDNSQKGAKWTPLNAISMGVKTGKKGENDEEKQQNKMNTYEDARRTSW